MIPFLMAAMLYIIFVIIAKHTKSVIAMMFLIGAMSCTLILIMAGIKYIMTSDIGVFRAILAVCFLGLVIHTWFYLNRKNVRKLVRNMSRDEAEEWISRQQLIYYRSMLEEHSNFITGFLILFGMLSVGLLAVWAVEYIDKTLTNESSAKVAAILYAILIGVVLLSGILNYITNGKERQSYKKIKNQLECNGVYIWHFVPLIRNGSYIPILDDDPKYDAYIRMNLPSKEDRKKIQEINKQRDAIQQEWEELKKRAKDISYKYGVFTDMVDSFIRRGLNDEEVRNLSYRYVVNRLKLNNRDKWWIDCIKKDINSKLQDIGVYCQEDKIDELINEALLQRK